MTRLEEAICSWNMREYGTPYEETMKSIHLNPNAVDVAYTTMGDDEEYEVQVCADIPNLELNTYRDGALVCKYEYESEDDMGRDIYSCDFHDMFQGWEDGLDFNVHVWIVSPLGIKKDDYPNFGFADIENAIRFCEKRNYIWTDYYGFQWNLKIEMEDY